MKVFWRVVRWVGLVVLIVGAYVGYRIGFGKPFTINQLLTGRRCFFWSAIRSCSLKWA